MISYNGKPTGPLRRLSRSAAQGDIRAIFQLYINYRSGNYSAPDKNLSDKYLLQLIERIKDQKTILDEIVLNDFRGVNNLKISFNEQLTVLVGNNGFGKSTVLDAIAITLSWLKSNILREDRQGLPIKESDINNGNVVQYASITSKFILDGKPFVSMLSKAKEGSPDKRNNELVEIKSLASIYRHTNEVNKDLSEVDVDLPLLAYYSVARSTEGSGVDSKKTSQDNKSEWTKFDAYDDVLTDRHDFAEFFKWFLFINSMAQQNKKPEIIEEIKKLEGEIAGITSTLAQIKSESSISTNYEYIFEKEINFKKNTINKLNNEYYKNTDDTPVRLINSILSSFEKFLPALKNIRVHYNKNNVRLLIEKNGLQIDAQQLSQGEKSLLTLVGDLTRRLVILNSSKSNPLEGKGIVLIDEIDLHLHPLWQQTIIGNLLNTFPNIQFIISTHSPQVLSTVPFKNIRILKEEYNDETNKNEIVLDFPEFQTKGVKSTEVLNDVMETDPLPPIKEADWVEEYIKLIETMRFSEPDAIELKEKILLHFGKEHPLVKKCENLISLQIIKKKLAQRRLDKKDQI